MTHPTANAIKEFNEELDNYKKGNVPKNFTGGYFLVDNTIWGNLKKVQTRKLLKFEAFVKNKKYKGEDKFKGRGNTKLYGVIHLPSVMALFSQSAFLFSNKPRGFIGRECYEKVNIKTLRQLCKDNNIKVTGKTKKDVFKALMKN